MKYDKEIAALTIKNISMIENTQKVVAEIETTLFRALDTLVEDRVKASGLQIASDEKFAFYKDELSFGIENWGTGKDKLANYYLDTGAETDDEDWFYLTHALGEHAANATLRFVFNIYYYSAFNLKKGKFKKILYTLFAEQTELLALGFQLSETGETIELKFNLDKDNVADEYPDFDMSFDPVNNALDKLFEAHPYFEALVTKVQTLSENTTD